MNSISRHDTETTCPYCGVGCGVSAQFSGAGLLSIKGSQQHPANHGRLCVKGSALKETLDSGSRLLFPMLRGRRVGATPAVKAVADGFNRIIARHGPDAVAFYLSGQLLTEDYYVANKLMKGFIGSANVDTNSRLCMASAVAGYKRAFGADAVPCNYEDLEQTDLLILVGSNAAWTHPVLYQRMVAAKAVRPHMKIVLIDPRATVTCDIADLHLPLRPGSDAFLFNGLLHYLARQEQRDVKFIAQSCTGLEAALAAANSCDPESVSRQTGLDRTVLLQFFAWFAGNKRVLSFYSQGINQSATGTDKCNAIINCHLLTGKIGKPGCGPFSITGQPNAMGGREVGGLANQLAAHMDFDPVSVDRLKRFWGSDKVATQPGLRAVELFDAIEAGTVKAVWIMATNPVVSLPEAERIRKALLACELVVVSDCVQRTDTTACAHILLPATPWGEKDGTVTNSERCISRQRPLRVATGEARHDWQWICAVAKEMGFSTGFDFTSSHEIFVEHAALSGFENEGQRAFDISGLKSLTVQQYDRLKPIQWPVNAGNPAGTARLFTDGKFFTPDRRARFVAVEPTLPLETSGKPRPFILNTGRLRDQWHTMSRTGEVTRLLRHTEGPTAAMHPDDVSAPGLGSGELVRLESDHGSIVVPLVSDAGLRRGSVFVPIHWNEHFSANARVSKLISSTVDPWSGQPESKFARISVAPVPVTCWAAFYSRRETDLQRFTYWHRVPAPGGNRFLLAAGPDCDFPEAFVHNLIQTLNAPELVSLQDATAGDYRYLLFDEDELVYAVFCHPRRRALPEPQWLEALAQVKRSKDNWLLLSGQDLTRPEKGRLVCSCYEVGVNQIQAAINSGARDHVALGNLLRCGTNCGSCIPELKQLLQQVGTPIT
ncbi:MAG: molybdopterin-dependent oxidoreductase [Pseudohongiellaceae bacterium]